jgi:hypothetical protein
MKDQLQAWLRAESAPPSPSPLLSHAFRLHRAAYARAMSDVLSSGTSFDSITLSPAEATYVRRLGICEERYPAHYCYANARQLVLSTRRLTYHVGFAVRTVHSFPTQHAWASLNGKVIDPTWNIYGVFAGHTAYHGVAVSRAQLGCHELVTLQNLRAPSR